MTGPAQDLLTSSPSHVDPNAGSHSSETSSTNQTSVKSSSDPSSPAITGNASPDLCISGCRRGTLGGGEMIRCCICGKWFHIKCLRLSQDECAGVWPCYDCRTRSRSIATQNNRDLHQAIFHFWSKFGDPNLNGWWVMVRTSSKWGKFWLWS